jgi:stearoyl-CoA desaturase (delta-9 desaturase)
MHYQSDGDESPGILWTNAAFLILTPLMAAVALPLYIMEFGVHWAEPVAFTGLWFLTGLGITAGYHRMFSHRSWWASKPVRALFLILGAATWQNSAIAWCSKHRTHHHHTDTDKDPHNIEKGFLWAHMLWVMVDGEENFDNAPDLTDDALCQWQHNNYLAISTAFNVGVPVLLGLFTGRILGMLLWAGLLRVVVLHHLTFFINSLAHMWGEQPWNDEGTARDNPVLAVLTLGEGYHNFHHEFPGDYRNGVRWYQFDPTKWTIWSLSKLGLAEDLRRSAIDHRLRRRWEQMRDKYEAQMSEWNDEFERKIESAEERFEEALEEMRNRRTEWTRKAEELQSQAREELRAARKDAEDQAIDAFQQCRQLLEQKAADPA